MKVDTKVQLGIEDKLRAFEFEEAAEDLNILLAIMAAYQTRAAAIKKELMERLT